MTPTYLGAMLQRKKSEFVYNVLWERICRDSGVSPYSPLEVVKDHCGVVRFKNFLLSWDATLFDIVSPAVKKEIKLEDYM